MTEHNTQQIYYLKENQKKEINISNEEGKALRLLEDKLFRFSNEVVYENEDTEKGRFKLKIEPGWEESISITVENAIGQIVVGDVVINIEPKIGSNHFFKIYDFNKNKYEDLTISDTQGNAQAGDIMYLVLVDFLHGVEKVVNNGVRKGYKQIDEEIKFIKGRVDVLKTTRNLLSGRLGIQTEYEEFTIDTPMNRLIKSALVKVKNINEETSISLLNYEEIVATANRLHRHFEFIPEYNKSDFRVKIDRNTKYYEQALVGAKNILQFIGASVQYGDTNASARLIKTDKVIESGLRYFLNENLPDRFVCNSEKPGELLTKEGKVRQPDLLFGYPYIATGDIKYKTWSNQKNIDISDINQSVTFAVLAKVTKALVLGFSESDFNFKRNTDIYDDIYIFTPTWNIDMDPKKAAELFLKHVVDFLET